SGLGNAVSGILVIKAGRREWGHSRNGSRASESRTVEVRKVHMELPEVQRARAWVDVHEEVRRTGGRRGRPIEVGRQEAGERAGKLKALVRRPCGAAQHGVTVPRARLRSSEVGAVLKNVPGDVIAVLPHGDLVIVVHIRAETI